MKLHKTIKITIILAVVACLAMVALMFVACGNGDYGVAEDFSFSRVGAGYTVTGAIGAVGDVLVIPDEHNGVPVTAIGTNAFQNTTVYTVVISNNVTVIGDYAFDGAANLVALTLPLNMQSIGRAAFRNNVSLGALFINATTIGDYAFYGNTELSAVTLGDDVITIGTSAFEGNTLLSAITLGSAVEVIGDRAFYGAVELAAITIISNVTTIGSEAFSGASALSIIMIPESVVTIGENAFANTDNLMIFAGADGAPAGWHVGWNPMGHDVFWGHWM